MEFFFRLLNSPQDINHQPFGGPHRQSGERRIYAPSPALGGSKYRAMKDHDPGRLPSDHGRANVLASAIVLRVCSLRADVSFPVRRACRTQMRAQAIKWRQIPGNRPTSSAGGDFFAA
jgi:hypothetical protein